MRVSNCTEFSTHLNASIEGRTLPDTAALEMHAAECAACLQLLVEYRLLDRAITAWKSDVPEVDLVDAVLARRAFSQSRDDSGIKIAPVTLSRKARERVLETSEGNGQGNSPLAYLHPQEKIAKQSPDSRSPKGALAALAVAASLLVLVFVASNSNGPIADRQPTHEVLAILETSTTPEAPPATAPDVEALVRDASSAYLELARDAADIFTDTIVLIPEPVLPPRSGDSTENDADQSTPWGQELDPIRRDVGHAFNFLLNTITTDPEPTT